MYLAAGRAFGDQQLTLPGGLPVGSAGRVDRWYVSAGHLYHPVNSVGRFSTNA